MSQTKTWYAIKNATAPTAEVYLYDEIGYWGVTASQFVKDLNAIKAQEINLYVNSPGGEVADGTAIYTALQRHPATVNATVDGMAASAASFIVQAADKRSMSKGSTMMVHDPWGMAVGDAATMAKMIEELDVFAESIADIYAEKAGGTADEWRAVMREETWYKAQEAVDAGLADEVIGASAKNVTTGRIFNLSKFKHVPDWMPKATGGTIASSGIDPEWNRTQIQISGDASDKQLAKIERALGAAGDLIVSSAKAAPVAPTAIEQVQRMKIPAADKRRAIAHLKAQVGATVAA